MKFIAIIPARYASTRFPGKPLASLAGHPIIEHVYTRAAKVFDHVIVATDDERIASCVAEFGGTAVMTGSHHKSGTDRCHEAYIRHGYAADVVVNIQGDEPFIDPLQLQAIRSCFDDHGTQIATLVMPFPADATPEELQSPNSPKVVIDDHGYAMYFSRSVIPFLRGVDPENWPGGPHVFYKHIGLYAYKTDVLASITKLPQSTLELAESLEQLRWLQAGYRIKTGISHIETIGIDTPADLQHAEEYIKAHSSDLA